MSEVEVEVEVEVEAEGWEGGGERREGGKRGK